MIGSLFRYKYLQICIYQRSLYSPHEFLKSLNIFPFVYDSCLPCNHTEKVDSFIRLSFAVPSSWTLLRRQYISLILYKQRKICVVLIFNIKIAYAPFISTSLNYLNYVRWSVDTWWIVDVAILLLLEETSLPIFFIFFFTRML